MANPSSKPPEPALAHAASPVRIEPLCPGPVPLYYQLEQDLRGRIDAREFAPGDPLPSEDQICEQYGVSRITVRRALESLHQQGLIDRRRGVGSFVATRPDGLNSHLRGSLNEFLASASALTTRCLALERAVPPAKVATLLELAEGEEAIRLDAVGSLDGTVPVAYLEIWFPLDIGEILVPDDIVGTMPVIRLVEAKKQLRVTRAEQVISPGHAGEDAARQLGIAPDAPILKATRVYFAGKDRPIEVAIVRYHPERYRYAVDYRG